tara:strand:- start:1307 stop:1843 length:537 start_codon:yes stop_codon:yes gene_type:complete
METKMQNPKTEMLDEIIEALKDSEPMHITECENYETCDYCNPSIKLDDDDDDDSDEPEIIEAKQIPFGIRMKCTRYAESETAQWLDGGGDAYHKEEWDVYKPFLDDFRAGKLKPTTMVDALALIIFQSDVDNRASIDYREGEWDDEPEIYNGGKWFDEKQAKLKAHLNKHGFKTIGQK